MIGASLLWVGWFGFNAGSDLEANGIAGARRSSTPSSPPLPRRWRGCSSSGSSKGKPSLLGCASGAVAGLVAITPASRLRRSDGRDRARPRRRRRLLLLLLGVKNALGYDDSLDVFGVHCIGGIIGALGTGILVNPDLGRRRDRRLSLEAGRADGRHLRHGRSGDRHRPRPSALTCCGAASAPRSSSSWSTSSWVFGQPRKRNARVSTSPITASGPTTTDQKRPAARSRSAGDRHHLPSTRPTRRAQLARLDTPGLFCCPQISMTISLVRDNALSTRRRSLLRKAIHPSVGGKLGRAMCMKMALPRSLILGTSL